VKASGRQTTLSVLASQDVYAIGPSTMDNMRFAAQKGRVDGGRRLSDRHSVDRKRQMRVAVARFAKAEHHCREERLAQGSRPRIRA